MAELDPNEFTISGFCDYLNAKLGCKNSGKPFNSSDIAQYRMRGYIPAAYGGNKITESTNMGITYIKLGPSEMRILKDEILEQSKTKKKIVKKNGKSKKGK